MIQIKRTRFGTVEVSDDAEIVFQNGLFGFPDERGFVLIEQEGSNEIGYLQSVNTAWLAFPVLDAAALAPHYPVPAPKAIARAAELEDADVAMLVLLTEDGDKLTPNLLAPVVIDMKSRQAVQVVLDPLRYAKPPTQATTVSAAEQQGLNAR